MLKKQKNEELRKKERLMRYHDYGRKKLLLLKLAMTTLITLRGKETSAGMNPHSDDWFRMILHHVDDHFYAFVVAL